MRRGREEEREGGRKGGDGGREGLPMLPSQKVEVFCATDIVAGGAADNAYVLTQQILHFSLCLTAPNTRLLSLPEFPYNTSALFHLHFLLWNVRQRMRSKAQRGTNSTDIPQCERTMLPAPRLRAAQSPPGTPTVLFDRAQELVGVSGS